MVLMSIKSKKKATYLNILAKKGDKKIDKILKGNKKIK